MKILIPFTQVYEALTEGYGHIDVRVAKTISIISISHSISIIQTLSYYSINTGFQKNILKIID